MNVYAAHGYGPVLQAGTESPQLLQQHPYGINEQQLGAALINDQPKGRFLADNAGTGLLISQPVRSSCVATAV